MRLRHSLGQSWECEVFLTIFHILVQSEKTQRYSQSNILQIYFGINGHLKAMLLF